MMRCRDEIPVEKLREALERAVASGAECGVQLVIYEHGKLIADLCAGYADKAHKVPVSPHTLFPVFSVVAENAHDFSARTRRPLAGERTAEHETILAGD